MKRLYFVNVSFSSLLRMLSCTAYTYCSYPWTNLSFERRCSWVAWDAETCSRNGEKKRPPQLRLRFVCYPSLQMAPGNMHHVRATQCRTFTQSALCRALTVHCSLLVYSTAWYRQNSPLVCPSLKTQHDGAGFALPSLQFLTPELLAERGNEVASLKHEQNNHGTVCVKLTNLDG